MTMNAVVRAANDPDLQSRVQAAVYGEAINNATLKDTVFAQQVRTGYGNFTAIYWAVAQAVQAAYDSGIASGRGSPGHDADVVTDGAITSAVVANWPPDPPAPTPAAAPAAAPTPAPETAPAPDKPAKVVSKRGTK